jgi:thymidylate synthase ThyX
MVDVKVVGMTVPVKIRDDMLKARELIESYKNNGSASAEELNKLSSALEQMISQFTPEPITAAFSRISRSPDSISKLLDNALLDVPKARASNESIIFGMGHHAVADNASFAITLENVSRIVVEKYEKRRIGFGAVEKSQRYITLDGDYVRPTEFSEPDMAKFEKLISHQNKFYFETKDLIFQNLMNKNSSKLDSASSDKMKKDILSGLEGQAKEDARYSLSFATKAQLGSSLSATAAEHMIRTLKYGPLDEERELAKQHLQAAQS